MVAVWVLGQMSGTSADGVDVALLRTDGEAILEPGPGSVHPYRSGEREAILAGARCARESRTEDLMRPESWPEPIRMAEEAATAAHLRALSEHLGSFEQRPALIGYHGQTLVHRPAEGFTLQVGCARQIAADLRLPVTYRHRQADLRAGGEGAPLAPFFHHALARTSDLSQPAGFLNLGGIGNLTAVDPRIREPDVAGAVSAFDTGPGCGLIDEWTELHGLGSFDRNGFLAGRGTVSRAVLDLLLQHGYFSHPPPKSLDRGAFSLDPVKGMTAEDGAATLVAFTAEAVGSAVGWLTPRPGEWFVCGGGRRNPVLMSALQQTLGVSVRPIESLGWDGDLLEAYAFAFLGMRALKGQTISAPSTTGCIRPAVGGEVANPH